MNTAAVAKELGVSTKTVQRWVKQLNLPMERNELGHYHYGQNDLELLKNVREQLHNGVLLQDIKAVAKTFEETSAAAAEETIEETSTPENDSRIDELEAKLQLLEQKLNHKADAVVSYQLLQHRREMEELNTKIQKIEQTIDILFAQLPDAQTEPALTFEHQKVGKRKGLLKSIFSL
ncbi:MerR family transcriptional regulator [Bacillus mangrovi]|uniref:Chromosome-anchoring protein RacA n=1 Tax=Metabacillus mangrovi TaxID=1491830 RepID=A0A7X2S688_9BACI|nr:MerR family transcriptional regulator [Metabacillus mangrovi]MTH54038.1 MerR family transcriptional regulator [Metabacillus mangrovi]